MNIYMAIIVKIWRNDCCLSSPNDLGSRAWPPAPAPAGRPEEDACRWSEGPSGKEKEWTAQTSCGGCCEPEEAGEKSPGRWASSAWSTGTACASPPGTKSSWGRLSCYSWAGSLSDATAAFGSVWAAVRSPGWDICWVCRSGRAWWLGRRQCRTSSCSMRWPGWQTD